MLVVNPLTPEITTRIGTDMSLRVRHLYLSRGCIPGIKRGTCTIMPAETISLLFDLVEFDTNVYPYCCDSVLTDIGRGGTGRMRGVYTVTLAVYRYRVGFCLRLIVGSSRAGGGSDAAESTIDSLAFSPQPEVQVPRAKHSTHKWHRGSAGQLLVSIPC